MAVVTNKFSDIHVQLLFYYNRTIMKRFILTILISVTITATFAQSCIEDAENYKIYLDNLFLLSKTNSKRIDTETVSKVSKTKKNPQKYIDAMLIRYEHSEIIIQRNIYYHCLGAIEELQPCVSNGKVKDYIDKFTATAELTEERINQLENSERSHIASFELTYGYPELINFSNILVEEEQELSTKFGLTLE